MFGVLVNHCTVTPGGAPIPLTEDAVSSTAVSAANCELACTESCERVSSFTPVGEDIVHFSVQKFPAKQSSKTAVLRLILLRRSFQPIPCKTRQLPNTTISKFESLVSLRKISRPPVKLGFQLTLLAPQRNPSRQPPLELSFDSFVRSFCSRLQNSAHRTPHLHALYTFWTGSETSLWRAVNFTAATRLRLLFSGNV